MKVARIAFALYVALQVLAGPADQRPVPTEGGAAQVSQSASVNH